MIRSMTGFGKAQIRSPYGMITIEIRALNHKYFEVSAKAPNGLSQYEDSLKEIIHQRVKRGKIYLSVDINGQRENSPIVTINEKAARRYANELRSLKRGLRLKGDLTLNELIALPGVIVAETPKMDSRKLILPIKKVLKKALKELLKDKAREGRALSKDLSSRAINIQTIITDIDRRASISVTKYKRHLTNKIKELTGTRNVDRGRLEQEVALFAKNCDISEELTRLKSHLVTLRNSLKADSEAGKKLDFMAQELHREANTIGSKSSDFKISRYVIQIKSDIEKIREQVKNIE